MPSRFFIIIISGRSGSSYLRDLLNQDPRIFMWGEMLVNKSDRQQKEALQDFFTGKLAQRDGLVGKEVLGFKTKLNDVADLKHLQELIERYQPHIIINRRQNHLRQAISRARMLVLLDRTVEKYGKPHHSPRSKADIVDAIEVDVDNICKFTKDFETRDSILANFSHAMGNLASTIYYEDFAEHPQVAIDRLSSILNIKIKVENYDITYKNTAQDLRQAISNYDELKTKLENTPYSSMLDI